MLKLITIAIVFLIFQAVIVFVLSKMGDIEFSIGFSAITKLFLRLFSIFIRFQGYTTLPSHRIFSDDIFIIL
jgi:hypothetical protein